MKKDNAVGEVRKTAGRSSGSQQAGWPCLDAWGLRDYMVGERWMGEDRNVDMHCWHLGRFGRQSCEEVAPSPLGLPLSRSPTIRLENQFRTRPSSRFPCMESSFTFVLLTSKLCTHGPKGPSTHFRGLSLVQTTHTLPYSHIM